MSIFKATVPALMYHHVSPAKGMVTVSVENFEDQLRWLQRNGYTSLTSTQFAGHLRGEAIPARSILITFDDGYLDNWVYAYPLLKKYGFTALMFLVTSWVKHGASRPYLGQANIPETPEHRECEARVKSGRSDDIAVRWSEILAMQQDGVFEIHSHTHTHTRWDKLDPANKNQHMASELANARQALCENLGSVSDHHCWPQGYFDDDYIRIAQQAGFRYLYTTKAFGQNQSGTDPAHIYRFAVRDTSGASVGRRIRVAAHPLIAPVFNGFKTWKRRQRGSR